MEVLKKLSSVSLILLITALIFTGGTIMVKAAGPVGNDQTVKPAQLQAKACTCAPKDTLNCRDFAGAKQAQACLDACLVSAGYDVYDLDTNNNGLACETTAYENNPASEAPVQNVATKLAAGDDTKNLVGNGNFEYGFYQVPELGFEARNVGNIPIGWKWYKSNTYGKVTIDNNPGFGLICRDDKIGEKIANQPAEENSPFGPIPGVVYVPPSNSAAFFIQTSDEPDMRLGIYQTVDVVPGRDYRFSMSGTIQIQDGAHTLQSTDPKAPIQAQNHTIEVFFDTNGGTDWQVIPLEDRHVVEFKEERLEFKTTANEKDLATIQDFETTVRARSNKLTVFIDGWRKWANWRTAVFTIDCVSLVPVTVTSVKAPVQPAAVIQVATQTTTISPATQIIPPSGGILEKTGNSVLIVVASVVVLLGLVGAGIWNMRR